ncbi:hypothetical protein SLA2020_272420 [Shorea laevis]
MIILEYRVVRCRGFALGLAVYFSERFLILPFIAEDPTSKDLATSSNAMELGDVEDHAVHPELVDILVQGAVHPDSTQLLVGVTQFITAMTQERKQGNLLLDKVVLS